MAQPTPMEELERIATKSVNLCLSFIIENEKNIKDNGGTHLVADFRANMREWKSLIDFNTVRSPIRTEDNFKDKKILNIIFLMNDGCLEGFMYLLPTTDGKMNYALRMQFPVPTNSPQCQDRIKLIDRIKTKN